MQEVVLRYLVKIAGLHEMTIWRNRNNAWHLSVTVKSRPHVLYLSTRRACSGPSRASRRDNGSVPSARSGSCSGKRKTNSYTVVWYQTKCAPSAAAAIYNETPSRRKGSGEPVTCGGLAEKTLILEIGEPCSSERCELLLQPRIHVGFLAGLVIAIHLLHDAHVIVPE